MGREPSPSASENRTDRPDFRPRGPVTHYARLARTRSTLGARESYRSNSRASGVEPSGRAHQRVRWVRRRSPCRPVGSSSRPLGAQPSPGSAAVPWERSRERSRPLERSRSLGAQPFPGSAGVPWGASAAVRLAHTRSLGAQPSPESAAVPWERGRPVGRSRSLGAQPSPESAAVPWERSRPLRAQPFPGSAAVP